MEMMDVVMTVNNLSQEWKTQAFTTGDNTLFNKSIWSHFSYVVPNADSLKNILCVLIFFFTYKPYEIFH